MTTAAATRAASSRAGDAAGPSSSAPAAAAGAAAAPDVASPSLPPKPKFDAMTAFDANGKRIEFRRVRMGGERRRWEGGAWRPAAAAAAAGGRPRRRARPRCSRETTKRRRDRPPPPFPSNQVPVPTHRLTPLKSAWLDLYKPVTEVLGLDMRMNLKTRRVEIRTTPVTPDAGALQRAADFVHAFVLGFALADAVALLRLDDLYVECFEVKDVKTLRGEHLARCVGRLAGKQGKTKFTIENATRTRIVLADTRIHILGSHQNIRAARDAVCGLILGSPPGKVYAKLRSVCARLHSSY
jgi:RNA-binding protein PNO1